MADHEGATAWVTGAASGIGRAIALRLAADGATVGLLDVDEGALADVASQVSGASVCCDIADAESVATEARALEDRIGAPSILVNAAGISMSGSVVEHDEQSWLHVLGVNLNGAFHMTRAVLGGMIERRAGRIVNIASGTAVRVSAGAAAYASSKAGLITFTKAVALEGAPFGVTANAVAPGLVDTAMTRRLMPSDSALLAAATTSPIANPMGVVLTPEDIAHAVAFLCHPHSGRITGQVLHVNAGALMP